MQELRRCALLMGVVSGIVGAIAGCGSSGDGSADARPRVAVSIFPLYDIARRVAGDRLDTVLVLPPGRSEHGYEPTPREMTRVSGARLGLLVGLELDPWAERIIRAAAGEDVQLVRLGPEVDPRRLSEPEVGVDLMEHARAHRDEDAHHDEDGHHDEGEAHHDGDGDHDEGDDHHDADGDHDEGEVRHHEDGDAHDDEGGAEPAAAHEHHHHHGSHDPHFWLDPVRMITAVDRMVAAFSRLDPQGAEGFRTRGEAVKGELRALHARIEARARAWQSRTIVTFHGSFGYFAERYGLRIAAVIEPFPGREPTPRYMQDVIGAIRASGARALFSEPQLDPRPARVIAREAGVALHSLDPVGGTDRVDTYERLLLHDVAVLDEALGSGD